MRGRTQAERRAATRKSLIDAAGELLVEQGWAQVTSVAVCARAGLTRGAFVHHFDGLPDLFAAVLNDRYDRIESAAESAGDATRKQFAVVTKCTLTLLKQPTRDMHWISGRGGGGQRLLLRNELQLQIFDDLILFLYFTLEHFLLDLDLI